MTESIRLEPNTAVAMLWDFFGPHAPQTAEHHRIHLGEFVQAEQLKPLALELVNTSDKTTVSMVLPWNVVQELKPILKPHRGQIWTKPPK